MPPGIRRKQSQALGAWGYPHSQHRAAPLYLEVLERPGRAVRRTNRESIEDRVRKIVAEMVDGPILAFRMQNHRVEARFLTSSFTSFKSSSPVTALSMVARRCFRIASSSGDIGGIAAFGTS